MPRDLGAACEEDLSSMCFLSSCCISVPCLRIPHATKLPRQKDTVSSLNAVKCVTGLSAAVRRHATMFAMPGHLSDKTKCAGLFCSDTLMQLATRFAPKKEIADIVGVRWAIGGLGEAHLMGCALAPDFQGGCTEATTKVPPTPRYACRSLVDYVT